MLGDSRFQQAKQEHQVDICMEQGGGRGSDETFRIHLHGACQGVLVAADEAMADQHGINMLGIQMGKDNARVPFLHLCLQSK